VPHLRPRGLLRGFQYHSTRATRSQNRDLADGIRVPPAEDVDLSEHRSNCRKYPIHLSLWNCAFGACHLKRPLLPRDTARAILAARPDSKIRFQTGPISPASRDLIRRSGSRTCGWPSAHQFLRESGHDTIAGDVSDVVFVLAGSCNNHVFAALRALGLRTILGQHRIPLHVLNCVYPAVLRAGGNCAAARVLVHRDVSPNSSR